MSAHPILSITVAPRRTPLARALARRLPSAMLGVGLLLAPAAMAASWEVVNNHDAGSGSLRDAITRANNSPGADTISFAPQVTGVITLTSSELSITDAVTILGPGAELLAVDGSGIDWSTPHSVFAIQWPGGATPRVAVAISGLGIHGGAAENGGGIYAHRADLSLDDCIISGNLANVHGGGIFASFSQLHIRNSIISGNSAGQSGGGIASVMGLLDIEHGSIDANDAKYHGGGIYGLGNTNVSNRIALHDTIISNNTARQSGGGLHVEQSSTTVSRSGLLSNHATGHGGAVFSSYGWLDTEDSLIAGNTTQASGGGIFATVNWDTAIQRSTVSGNQAGNDGGGLFIDDGQIRIHHSTISGNLATGNGGALVAHGDLGDEVEISHSTISGNRAATISGGILAVSDRDWPARIDIRHSVIAANSIDSGPLDLASHWDDVPPGSDGPSFRLAWNLVQQPGTANISDLGGNLFHLDPLLGPLGDNGGPTPTRLPQAQSPLIDAGDPAFTGSGGDQRGFARVGNGRIDIGAVESHDDRLFADGFEAIDTIFRDGFEAP